MSTIDPTAAPAAAPAWDPTLACPSCEDTGPFWACVIPACPVVECSECGERFSADTGDTGCDARCLAESPTP